MKLLEAQFTFSRNLGRLIFYANNIGYEVTLGEVYRTQEQQDIYFSKGLTRVKHSQHQNRLAVDINLFKDGNLVESGSPYSLLHSYWKSMNKFNTAEFKNGFDKYHFEMKPDGL